MRAVGSPNQAGAGNGATAILFHFRRLVCAVPDQNRWMNAARLTCLLLLAVPLFTGCLYTYTQAPGATGKVVDAETGAPVRAAQITRPRIRGGLGVQIGIPLEGLPAETVSTDKGGQFNLPPALHTQIKFMYLHNPTNISGHFLVSADGYTTNEVQGTATSRTFWRADLGRILLKKP